MPHNIKTARTMTAEQIDNRNRRLFERLQQVVELRAHAWRIVAKQYPNGYNSQDVEKVPQWIESVAIANEIFEDERVNGTVL